MKIIINLFLSGFFYFINIASFASTDFVDKTIINLIGEKVADSRVSIELEYNSKSQADKVKSSQDKIETIIIENIDPKFATFKVKINYANGKSDMLSGRYISYAFVPIASKYIKFGDIIGQSDIITKKLNLDTVNRGYLTEIEEVVGMQAKKYIPAGSMFQASEIMSPNVIKTGDPVNIIYSSGVINLKTAGIAMGGGAVGDTVKIKNSSSGAILLGEIINKNTVKIGGDNE